MKLGFFRLIPAFLLHAGLIFGICLPLGVCGEEEEEEEEGEEEEKDDEKVEDDKEEEEDDDDDNDNSHL